MSCAMQLISLVHVFGDVTVANAAVPKANLEWVFLLGLAPFLCLVVLFCCPGDETHVWLGDVRVVLFCGGCFICDLICLSLVLANCAMYLFSHRLCLFQDRATVHLRPNSRKKTLAHLESCLGARNPRINALAQLLL